MVWVTMMAWTPEGQAQGKQEALHGCSWGRASQALQGVEAETAGLGPYAGRLPASHFGLGPQPRGSRNPLILRPWGGFLYKRTIGGLLPSEAKQVPLWASVPGRPQKRGHRWVSGLRVQAGCQCQGHSGSAPDRTGQSSTGDRCVLEGGPSALGTSSSKPCDRGLGLESLCSHPPSAGWGKGDMGFRSSSERTWQSVSRAPASTCCPVRAAK